MLAFITGSVNDRMSAVNSLEFVGITRRHQIVRLDGVKNRVFPGECLLDLVRAQY